MKYDYTDSGFDGFLSRSVDDISQTNLGSGGPQSTAQAYDRTQVTGKLGDKLSITTIKNINIGDIGQSEQFVLNNEELFIFDEDGAPTVYKGRLVGSKLLAKPYKRTTNFIAPIRAAGQRIPENIVNSNLEFTVPEGVTTVKLTVCYNGTSGTAEVLVYDGLNTGRDIGGGVFYNALLIAVPGTTFVFVDVQPGQKKNFFLAVPVTDVSTTTLNADDEMPVIFMAEAA